MKDDTTVHVALTDERLRDHPLPIQTLGEQGGMRPRHLMSDAGRAELDKAREEE